MKEYAEFRQIQMYFIALCLEFLKNHKNIMEIILSILMNNCIKSNNFYLNILKDQIMKLNQF